MFTAEATGHPPWALLSNNCHGEGRRRRCCAMVQELPLADELAAVFARMSGLLMSEETTSTAVNLVTAFARGAIPGAVGAGAAPGDHPGRQSTAGGSGSAAGKAPGAPRWLGEGA